MGGVGGVGGGGWGGGAGPHVNLRANNGAFCLRILANM